MLKCIACKARAFFNTRQRKKKQVGTERIIYWVLEPVQRCMLEGVTIPILLSSIVTQLIEVGNRS